MKRERTLPQIELLYRKILTRQQKHLDLTEKYLGELDKQGGGSVFLTQRGNLPGILKLNILQPLSNSVSSSGVAGLYHWDYTWMPDDYPLNLQELGEKIWFHWYKMVCCSSKPLRVRKALDKAIQKKIDLDCGVSNVDDRVGKLVDNRQFQVVINGRSYWYQALQRNSTWMELVRLSWPDNDQVIIHAI